MSYSHLCLIHTLVIILEYCASIFFVSGSLTSLYALFSLPHEPFSHSYLLKVAFFFISFRKSNFFF
uniref:Uncharacterized protein n=1 Tax=Rhizophora mucronata TaxID=61149 RepID=A0A2P2R1W6_RHIMU